MDSLLRVEKRARPDGSSSWGAPSHPKRTGSGRNDNGSAHSSNSGKGAPGRAAAASPQRLRAGFTDLGAGAGVHYFPGVLARRSTVLMQALQTEAQWQEREVVVFGRRLMQPRKVAYMADDASLSYTYSGLTLTPQTWDKDATPAACEIRDALCAALADAGINASFNSCLLNLYRTGQDHLGWHADDEPLYGSFPTIASVSLGAHRDFDLRCTDNKSLRYRVTLGLGDVLVMQGSTQRDWQHCVPKRTAIGAARMSLTFRRVIKP